MHTTQFRQQTRPAPPKTGRSPLGISVAPAITPDLSRGGHRETNDCVDDCRLFPQYRGSRRGSPRKTAEAPGHHPAHHVWRPWWGLDRCRQRVVGHALHRDDPPALRPEVSQSTAWSAKRYARTGQLPPGWQKKVEPFPASLERECAPLPAGYRRGVIDAHAVIYDSRGTIIDVVVLF